MVHIYGTTIDHGEIKNWVSAHHGRPQIIDDPTTSSDNIGVRIDFPGGADDVFFAEDKKPRNISWTEFFNIFDKQKLAFSFNNDVFRGNPSRSYNFLKRASR